ncbi:hypothetical protein [Streptomyces kasugaensis]|uniref:hypothetical protein n=1 Tax=Streptomyces kasugaensis TaxID=1946 RepID=UPI0013EFC1B8|nr:hypothetical protein [Streptomyces kasugaensis]
MLPCRLQASRVGRATLARLRRDWPVVAVGVLVGCWLGQGALTRLDQALTWLVSSVR